MSRKLLDIDGSEVGRVSQIGVNEDGTPKMHYELHEEVSQFHATRNADPEAFGLIYVGPYIWGTVELPDGTVVDVNADVIAAPVKLHGVIDEAIGMRHEREGHPMHAPTKDDPNPEPFKFVRTAFHDDPVKHLKAAAKAAEKASE